MFHHVFWMLNNFYYANFYVLLIQCCWEIRNFEWVFKGLGPLLPELKDLRKEFFKKTFDHHKIVLLGSKGLSYLLFKILLFYLNFVHIFSTISKNCIVKNIVAKVSTTIVINGMVRSNIVNLNILGSNPGFAISLSKPNSDFF